MWFERVNMRLREMRSPIDDGIADIRPDVDYPAYRRDLDRSWTAVGFRNKNLIRKMQFVWEAAKDKPLAGHELNLKFTAEQAGPPHQVTNPACRRELIAQAYHLIRARNARSTKSSRVAKPPPSNISFTSRTSPA